MSVKMESFFIQWVTWPSIYFNSIQHLKNQTLHVLTAAHTAYAYQFKQVL